MDVISFELQIHSSLTELSRFKNFITTDYNKYTTNDGYRLRNDILRDLISHLEKLCLGADAITGKEKKLNQCNLGRTSSSGVKLLVDTVASAPKKIVRPENCSRGNLCISSRKGKGVLQAGAVKQLNDRLKILEEETETMKKDIFGALEESRRLANDIYKLFQIIQRQVCLQNQVIGERCSDNTLITNSSKDGRMGGGLSEVFCQEPSSSLVTKDLRANMLAFQEPA